MSAESENIQPVLIFAFVAQECMAYGQLRPLPEEDTGRMSVIISNHWSNLTNQDFGKATVIMRFT